MFESPGGQFNAIQSVSQDGGREAIDTCAVLKLVCEALLMGSSREAAQILENEYPFAPQPPGAHKYGPRDATRIFIRDGFIDRYSGQRLVFPPVMRVISMALPDAFPYHSNWKASATHPAYYELTATVDHLVPAARGGSDESSNLMTTSMARNSAKLDWSLEHLGWSLHPPGAFRDWDGLVGWFIDYTDAHPEPLTNSSIRSWRRASLAVLG